jgi:hypothetical protein
MVILYIYIYIYIHSLVAADEYPYEAKVIFWLFALATA